MVHEPLFEAAEFIIKESRDKRTNFISDKLDALFDFDKEENLKLKEELKNDSAR